MVWVNGAVAATVLAILVVWNLDGFDTGRCVLAAFALSAYGLILLRYRRQLNAAGPVGLCDYLLAYATETGTARQLAKATGRKLVKAGATVNVIELNRLAESPKPAKALLVVASTTGNGDSPRTGSDWPGPDESLVAYHGVDYAVLALGDRDYPRFCAFGLEVAVTLSAAGARALFPPVLVNRADPASVSYWYRQLGVH